MVFCLIREFGGVRLIKFFKQIEWKEEMSIVFTSSFTLLQ